MWSDPEGRDVTFATVTPPAHGLLTGTAPGLVYTPEPNDVGPDSFTFIVNDGGLNSSPGTVSLTVTPVNDTPVAVQIQ